MYPLKYSTAGQEIPLGYFLDSTDGDTEETGLTIANTDIKLHKTGATTLANKNSGGATHISNGIYYAVLDATDTNTYGPMKVFVHVSGALACVLECVVMNVDAYNALYAANGTGNIESNIVEIGGDAQSMTDLKDFADEGYDPATNKVQGVVLTDTCTTNTDMVSEPPTAAANADAVWDEAIAGHVGAGTFGAKNQKVVPSETINDYKADVSGVAVPGSEMNLADDAITSAKYDESTAFPIKSADSGATQIARTGADADTLETLSDEIALVYTDTQRVDGLIEDDVGDQFTTKALSQAPAGGGGGDATAANQTLMLEDLADIKGTGFVKDTDSCVNLSHQAGTKGTDAIYDDTNEMQPKFGTLVDLGDGATIAGNMTALAGETADAGTYDRTTDSQEAIVGAGAGGAPTVEQIWQRDIENGVTAEQMMRLYAAVLAGALDKVGNNTPEFTALDGSTVRLKWATDGTGNRVKRITLDVS